MTTLLASCTPNDAPVTPKDACSGSPDLSLDGFAHELFASPPTPYTPCFDAYTAGSYHVDKRQLATELAGMAQQDGLEPRALIVAGPTGVLWTYHLLLFLRQGQLVRLNTITMPHARITGKATASFAPADVDDLLSSLESSPAVRPGLPPMADSATDNPEFAFDFVIADYNYESSQFFHADLMKSDSPEAVDALAQSLNAVLEKTTTTYPASAHSQ